MNRRRRKKVSGIRVDLRPGLHNLVALGLGSLTIPRRALQPFGSEAQRDLIFGVVAHAERLP